MLSSRQQMPTLSLPRQNNKLILQIGYKQKNFVVGEKVLRYNLRTADRNGGKQTDPWDGTYEVVQVCEKGLYQGFLTGGIHTPCGYGNQMLGV